MDPILVIVIIAVAGVVFFWLVARRKANRSSDNHTATTKTFMEDFRELPLQVLDEAIGEHIDVLVRKAKQKIVRDEYGVRVMDEWEKEMKYFVEKVVVPQIQQVSQDFINERNDSAYINKDRLERHESLFIPPEVIEKRINDRVLPLLEEPSDRRPVENLTGTEFEYLCAEILEQHGWDTHVTKGSGDQGVDLIAEREDIRVVLQCKKYSSPVGNKAVQEIFSGREFEDADYAAVVSNADYTLAAKQLAQKNGVLLLHPDDLKNLWAELRGEGH